MKRFIRRHQEPVCGWSGAKTGAGAAVSVAVIVWLAQVTGMPLLMAPFSATCVLLFAVPDSPLSQPPNVVLGYLVSTAVALAFVELAPSGTFAICAATGLSIMAMSLLRVTHPPAGATPLLVMTALPGAEILFSVLGAVVLVCLATLIHRLPPRSRTYPLPLREPQGQASDA